MSKEEFDIRYTEIEDGVYLEQWLSDIEVQKWFPMSTEKELSEATANWIGYSKWRSSLTLTVDGKPCGIGTLFLMPYKKVSHHCQFYLIVGKEHQRKGYGSVLLKNLLNLAKNYFKLEFVHIEVFEGCPILPLLEKFAFERFAYQEYYIKDNDKYLARILLEHFF